MANFNNDVGLVPDFGSPTKYSPKFFLSKFSDGFEQRLTEGLNQNFRTLNLKFTNITETESDSLISFLNQRVENNNESFDYIPPNDVTGKFVVEGNYTKTINYANRANVRVIFREVFEA